MKLVTDEKTFLVQSQQPIQWRTLIKGTISWELTQHLEELLM
jgi:hypothetical protein